MIKLTVSYARKTSLNYCSESAECGLQLDLESSWLDDATYLQERIKAAYQMCVDAVDVQLHGPAAVHAAPPAVQAPPPPPPATPARPEPPKSGPVNRVFGAPTTVKTFLGWFGKQEQAMKDEVKAAAKFRGLPSMFKEWTDDQARAVYAEVMAPPPAAVQAPPPQYNGGSDHESFMRRCAIKKAEERATAAAWAAAPAMNGNGRH
jgi:hypothetical protein